MKETRRSGDEDHNFTEQTFGASASSVEIALKPKGAEVIIKLYFDTSGDACEQTGDAFVMILDDLEQRLMDRGIPVAWPSRIAQATRVGGVE